MLKHRAILTLGVFFAVLMGSAHLSAQDIEQTHIIQPGETLFRISQQYGVSVETLASANSIPNTWRIFSGQTLVIPSAVSGEAPSAAPIDADISAELNIAPTPEPERLTHTVGWGESLGSIARRYNTSLDALARLNGITNPDLIYSGQVLTVVRGQPTEPSETASSEYLGSPYSSITHIVQPGDTLLSLGETYSVSWLQIAQVNNISNADRVLPGTELLIPGANALPGVEYSFVTAPAAPPARLATGREIIVDLSEQRIYAYEDGALVRSVIVSTGLPATPTVQGTFTAQRKYVAQTMTGPGYYLPDVPWVVYFYAGYALHGTYWHSNFGQPMSHGCVNLPTAEAEWFYHFSDYGTPIHVQT